ncbi:hypothetical protein Tco_1139518, partial [Tanacetum coccineum]
MTSLQTSPPPHSNGTSTSKLKADDVIMDDNSVTVNGSSDS